MYRTEANTAFTPAALIAAFDHRYPSSRPASRLVPRPSRYHGRDFGTGYGRSSGYGPARSYLPGNQPAPRFRVV